MNQAIRELLSQKRRLLIVIVVLLVLNVGLYVAINAYLAPSIIESQGIWNNLRQKVALAGKVDEVSVYSRGVDDLKKISSMIPVKRQFTRVLGDILDNAASSGVVTGSMSYKPQVVKGHEELLSYSLSMSVSGSYAAVKSFLGDLQKNSELIVIDGLTLSNGDLYEESVVMDLRLSVYLQGREGA